MLLFSSFDYSPRLVASKTCKETRAHAFVRFYGKVFVAEICLLLLSHYVKLMRYGTKKKSETWKYAILA